MGSAAMRGLLSLAAGRPLPTLGRSGFGHSADLLQIYRCSNRLGLFQSLPNESDRGFGNFCLAKADGNGRFAGLEPLPKSGHLVNFRNL